MYGRRYVNRHSYKITRQYGKDNLLTATNSTSVAPILPRQVLPQELQTIDYRH